MDVWEDRLIYSGLLDFFRSSFSLMRRSIQNINIPPPPGKPQAFELLKIELFKFPPPWAKITFKYPTLALDLTVKCPS